jgi:predicted deacetylase
MSPFLDLMYATKPPYRDASTDVAQPPERSIGHQNPAFCLVLHGVSQVTWPVYRPLVMGLDALGNIPVTLLVRPPLVEDLRFLAAMDGRLLRGDELVVYGCRQELGLDRTAVVGGPAPGAGALEARRALPEPEARARLREALHAFIRLDWPVHGFVAPGWRLGDGLRAALHGLPFLYTTNSGGLLRLSDDRELPAPALVGRDLGAPWQTSLLLRRDFLLPERALAVPCVRLVVHPMDMQHVDGPAFWLRAVRRVLRHRRALTLSDWLDLG